MSREERSRLRPEVEVQAIPQQEEDLQELAADIRREYERRREARRGIELGWRLNQRFLAGNQYCDIVPETGEVVDQGGEAWENRSVYNMIAPIVETRLAKLTRVQPGLMVRPLTEDAGDVLGARLGTRILKSVYNAQDMAHRQQEAALWAEICGSVFYKAVWNPRGGQLLGQADGETVFEGDVEVAVIPAYEIFPECCQREGMGNQGSIIHARVYGVDEIETLWGVRLPGRELEVHGMDTLRTDGGYHPQLGAAREERMKDAELVLEYFERPHAQFPQGRHVIVAGDQVVHTGALPFRNGENGSCGYPLIQQFCLKAAGCFFGSSVIERLIPLQRDYNALNNRINEYAARMTVGNLTVEQGTLVDDELLDSGIAPGTVIEYRAGANPPGWLTVKEIPQTLLARMEDMRKQFIDISGVSEMAKASAPTGSISSGVALEILREQDDTRLSLTAEHIRAAIRALGQHWLRLFRQFAVGSRLMRAAGDDLAERAAFLWQGKDLTSDDVVVTTDNEMSSTPAQRRQLALELMRAGLFLDPDTHRMTRESRAHLMEIFQMGNWESLADTDELQRNRAQLEQAELMRGMLPRIHTLDRHDLHLAEHTRFALSAEFRKLERSSRHLARALELHAEGHRALMQDQQQRQTAVAGS